MVRGSNGPINFLKIENTVIAFPFQYTARNQVNNIKLIVKRNTKYSNIVYQFLLHTLLLSRAFNSFSGWLTLVPPLLEETTRAVGMKTITGGTDNTVH